MSSTLLLSPFPNFEPLGLKHRAIINEFNSQLNSSYSDFQFSSLFGLDDNNTIKVSNLNGNMVVVMQDSVSGVNLASFLGVNQVDKSTRELLLYVKEELSTDCLSFLPRITVKRLADRGQFEISTDEANSDYLYDAAEIIDLKGRKYAAVRRKVNLCRRKYKPGITCFLGATPEGGRPHRNYGGGRRPPQEKSLIEKCWDLQQQITAEKIFDSNEMVLSWQRDNAGLEKLFLFWDKLELILCTVEMEGQIRAFAVVELIPQQTLLIHHFTTDTKFAGISEYLFWCLADSFTSGAPRPYSRGSSTCFVGRNPPKRTLLRSSSYEGLPSSHSSPPLRTGLSAKEGKVKFINFEQDLGFPGLRRFKNHLQPCGMLKKYVVRWSRTDYKYLRPEVTPRLPDGQGFSALSR
ncbi:DUF2156 domain-containing protein [Patescibacteria group bacterium]|nr:DUF2156 domain-containing protein [Patescibacteria group bacterium]